jgi:hypothetical protein
MANDVSTALPQVELLPGSTLTVTLSDANAKVLALNVHGFTDTDVAPATTPSPVKGAYTSGGGFV